MADVKEKKYILYRGSKRSDRCSLDPCHWLPHTGALTWKLSQGTKLYCLVNRGTLWSIWVHIP